MKVTEWIKEDHCAYRLLADHPDLPRNRVAFIEKTPRVSVPPNKFFEFKRIDNLPIRGLFRLNDEILTAHLAIHDGNWWCEGPKGSAPEYGDYLPSRSWCDSTLRQLGYELPENSN